MKTIDDDIRKIEELEDGSSVYEIGKLPEEESPENSFYDNLAKNFPEDARKKLATFLLDAIEEDIESRKEWMESVEKVKQYITTDTFKKDITELLEKSKKSFLLFMKEQVSDLQTKKFFLLSDEDTNVTDKKNILIYGHTPFRKNDGGIMAQYNLAYLLNKFGENVKILNIFDGNKENPIYNNF